MASSKGKINVTCHYRSVDYEANQRDVGENINQVETQWFLSAVVRSLGLRACSQELVYGQSMEWRQVIHVHKTGKGGTWFSFKPASSNQKCLPSLNSNRTQKSVLKQAQSVYLSHASMVSSKPILKPVVGALSLALRVISLTLPYTQGDIFDSIIYPRFQT